KQTIAGTRMRSDPITDAKVRQDIIAYISTLR
ncbi:MAG: cytochrome C, partial [Moraxella osloensis]|nr:cytochrome C [Moraxella osloensis]